MKKNIFFCSTIRCSAGISKECDYDPEKCEILKKHYESLKGNVDYQSIIAANMKAYAYVDDCKFIESYFDFVRIRPSIRDAWRRVVFSITISFLGMLVSIITYINTRREHYELLKKERKVGN
jgi:hypothetical protein